jgi:hypothetical protein
VRSLRASLEQLDVSSDMLDLQALSQNLDRMASCVAGGLGVASVDPIRAGGQAAAAAVNCANSFVQIRLTTELRNLQGDVIDAQRREVIANFNLSVIDYTAAMQAESVRASQALERIQMQLEIIESLRAQAQRSMDKALWYMSFQAENEVEISSVLSNISQGLKHRYDEALQNAKHMSFLAKRAIEQRLGMRLADMTDNLPLVEAPATWESTNCTMTGINYDDLTEEGNALNFADGFIGTYVNRLEEVVESYRLEHNFHEGQDIAVISLRDDIANTRVDCDVESRNLLYWRRRRPPGR